MRLAAKQQVEPAARAEATPRAASTTVSAADAAIAATTVRMLGGVGDGFPALRQLARPQQHQALLALQRTQGNAAVQRLLAGDAWGGRAGGAVARARVVQRYTSVEQEESENAVQRHTSTELEEPENAIQRSALIQRDLASNISAAMTFFVADDVKILAAIGAASADDKRAVLNNAPLRYELKALLPRPSMVQALHKLGAPLADQLDAAMEGEGAEASAIFAAIESPTTPAAQKQSVLRNPALMARLRDKLYQDAAIRAMRGLGASLTEILYAAMEHASFIAPANEDTLLRTIATAPANQKREAVRDRALIDLLADALSLGKMLTALEALGASLADRLNMAMDADHADVDAIDKIAASASEAQREEILGNTALMERLRITLDRAVMQSVLAHLRASLADRLMLELNAGQADAPTSLVLLEAAGQAERDLVRENTALVNRLRSALSASTFERVALLLELPAPVAVGAGSSVPMTLGGRGPHVDVDADADADLAEPRTLVGKISAALDQAPPDVAAAIVAIGQATPDELATVRGDTLLRERLYTALDQTQLLHAMSLLGVGLPARLTALLDRKATAADIRAHIAAATPAEKRSVLDDRTMIEWLVGYAGEAQRTALLGALGDSLGNQIDELLAGTPTLAALWNLIRGAADPARQEVVANSALMGRIAAAFGPHDVFKTQLLLIYGNEAAYPVPVTVLAGVSATPTVAAVKSALGNLADADLAKIRTPVREYLRPRLSDAHFATLLRILDQGLITEETINQKYKETLQDEAFIAGNPALPLFVPRDFYGTRGFDVAFYRDRVQVTVRIKFTAKEGDSQAKASLSALVASIETRIESAWDNSFSLRNGMRTLPIRIDMVPNSGSPHHHVSIGSQTNVPYPQFNISNWFPWAGNYNVANSILHEFGHMLGNLDEYNLAAADYQATVGSTAAADVAAGIATSETDSAAKQRFTNERSVMGSPPTWGGAGTIEKRHLNWFTNWLNRNRTAGEPAFTLV